MAEPTINWTTKVISVPQSYLALVSGTLYELDVNALRLSLKNIEDGEEGMAFADTHRHNTQVTLAGVTYARTLEIINGYTVAFEDGQYTVRCIGANHNLADVKVANQVSLIVGNAAGLVVAGSGVTQQDKADIVAGVWAETAPGAYGAGTTGYTLGHLADAVYQAKGWVIRGIAVDHYSIVWFKNGVPLFSGIASPTIQVVVLADGSDLVAQAAMTEVANTGVFMYDSSARMAVGSHYDAEFQATIDGGARIWRQPIGINA